MKKERKRGSDSEREREREREKEREREIERGAESERQTNISTWNCQKFSEISSLLNLPILPYQMTIELTIENLNFTCASIGEDSQKLVLKSLIYNHVFSDMGWLPLVGSLK